MAYDFSLGGIQQAQKEVNQIDGDFKKIATQIHSTFESIRKSQFDEINVCNAQITQLNAEIGQAEQAMEINTRIKNTAETKIARLQAELQKLEAQLAKMKSNLSSLKSQYNSLTPPSSTGNSEMDSAMRKAYQQKKAELQNQISNAQAIIANIENRIQEIKREIERLRQIIAKVNQNNAKLAQIKQERNTVKRTVQAHLSKLKETKSYLFEKHDAFNTYYGYSQNSMNDACQRVAQAFTTASMAVTALNRLGSGGDRVEMDDSALPEAIRVLEAYIGKLQESVKMLMDRKNAFRSKLKDKISERVKEDMERIDRIADEINSNIDNLTRILRDAQGHLSSYSALA